MASKARSRSADQDLDALCINTIRFLSADAIQKANSGHPGLPLGAAAMAYVLWTKYLKHNPKNPAWFNRDRFILSAGHGSMLLYSLLHLTGYDLPLEQIKQFRQWGSQTPGHPERGLTPGVEVTTGPLGQGFGNGVGMAIAEAYLAARFNRPGHEIVHHYTYAIVSDGDLMEGVASEAASLAGHLKLGKLIYLYDNNHVSLSAGTPITFTEDVAKRFEAYGWHTEQIEEGNNLPAIEAALRKAQQQSERPSLILVRTHLGYGSPNKQDTFEAHGSPLGVEELRLTKQNLGWPLEPDFLIPDQALAHFRQALEKGQAAEKTWNEKYSAYEQAFPDLAQELQEMIQGNLPPGWESSIPAFKPEEKGISTRAASRKVMNAIAPGMTSFISGSADLDPSTYTTLADLGDFESPQDHPADHQGSAGGGWNYSGRNLHFGVREHAMGSILNGLAAHGALLPSGATFLVFSDYMRPSIRLAALMGLHVIYVFTHDSVALGEDGPSHQPVEHLLSLRAIPNLMVIRPSDANETAAAWQIAVERKDGPTALILTRQNLPVLDPKTYPRIFAGTQSGGYVLSETSPADRPEVILLATGSEVSLALAAMEKLKDQHVKARVVSLPCGQLFEGQSDDYRRTVLPPGIPVLAIEAGVSLGWKSYIGSGSGVVAIDRFGASAPGGIAMSNLGMNVENILQRVKHLLDGKESPQIAAHGREMPMKEKK